MNFRSVISAASLSLGLLAASVSHALPVAVATWEFNGTLAANEGGAPALTAINPLGTNAFVTDTVFGVNRTVYQFNGNNFPVNQQAGVSVATTGLLTTGNAYSVDLIFKFNSPDVTSWESILNTSNRTSDNAFYVEPGHKLQVYPVGNGPDFFERDVYHRISLTNSGTGGGTSHVTAYFDGVFQFDLTTDVMDFTTYGAANPNNVMTFFADNVQGGGQGEYASGAVALIRLYDGELTSTEIGQLPTTTGNTVPEPGSMLLVGLSLAALGLNRRRKQ